MWGILIEFKIFEEALGRKMKTIILISILTITTVGFANPLGIVPLSNELSVFGNVDDRLESAGFTTQFVSLNMVYNIRFGFVVDWNFNDGNRDNYWELGVTVPLKDQLSISYQRVRGTFVNPNNQFGLTWRF